MSGYGKKASEKHLQTEGHIRGIGQDKGRKQGARGTHFLKSTKRQVESQEGSEGKGHSPTGEQRDMSGHGKKARGQGALTN
jgi:hypothetical protein